VRYVSRVRTGAVLAVVVLSFAPLASCGSDDGVDSDAGTSAAPPTDTDAGSDTDARDTDAGDELVALSGEEICGRLSIASVAADTGLDVVRAVPDDDATPQCAYEYTNDTNGVSNLTVASMRPQDVNGLAGSDAFDVVVGINESIAGDDADSQTVSAGDAAVRLSGTSLHLGVVLVGDRLLTLVIPVDDVEVDAVDRLIASMATTLV
jgi:hypothetical protein